MRRRRSHQAKPDGVTRVLVVAFAHRELAASLGGARGATDGGSVRLAHSGSSLVANDSSSVLHWSRLAAAVFGQRVCSATSC
jgi:hypothetical protein